MSASVEAAPASREKTVLELAREQIPEVDWRVDNSTVYNQVKGTRRGIRFSAWWDLDSFVVYVATQAAYEQPGINMAVYGPSLAECWSRIQKLAEALRSSP